MSVTLSSRWFKRVLFVRKHMLFGLAVLLVCSGVLLTVSVRQAETTLRSRQASYEAVIDLEVLVSNLCEIESGQRGFLLTNDQQYLGPFERSKVRIERHLLAVSSHKIFPRDDVARVENLVHDKLDELTATIQKAKAGKREAALAVVRTDRGKHYMDRMRVIVTTLEDAAIAERIRADLQLRQATQFAFVGFAALSLLTAIVLSILIVAYATQVVAPVSD